MPLGSTELENDGRDNTDSHHQCRSNACATTPSDSLEHLREPFQKVSVVRRIKGRGKTHQKGPINPQVCRTNVINTPTLAASAR
jgi:hypothetical protein